MKALKLIENLAAILLVGSTAGLASTLATSCSSDNATDAARDVIERAAGKSDNISLEIISKNDGRDCYEVKAEDGKLQIKGSSPVAICYAFNTYLHEACSSQITWGGKNLEIPEDWPDWDSSNTSPYKYRYFMNVCTFGYTAPYWDCDRWSQELDWMALHGINMPLASVASEAIAKRVWTRLGLTDEEADSFFTGPAHLPWHRMGNLNAWDGPLNDEWHAQQIDLQHKILEKMRSLGMEPVAPAFPGFIPPAFLKKHPEIQANQLRWGGFDLENNACVLSPDSPWFMKIGKMFVEEWEKEFGKARLFLSDSFNEMKLPVDKDDVKGKHELLAKYGETIYKSITSGDPDAIWVTQGWTFGYQSDFWDPESMQALLSKVPNDRLIIIDLGNDYPKWIWHKEQTWKVQHGFWGKQWIYSYVPNFGGKTLPTGDLSMYATASAEALQSPFGENLVGFGSAPEGLENNEVVYELLADMGWSEDAIDLEDWLKTYCKARYGYCDDDMMEVWEHLHNTVWSRLYSYPRFLWQTVKPDKKRKSVHSINDEFGDAVKSFLDLSDKCEGSPLYKNDAIEFAALWLAELADRHYEKAYELIFGPVELADTGKKLSLDELLLMKDVDTIDPGKTFESVCGAKKAEAMKELNVAVSILKDVDKLLASHPEYQLSDWVNYARKSSDNPDLQNQYESNAKRLITTWGGTVEDYAARFWSGLIADYYIPRMQLYFSDKAGSLDSWEESWVKTPWKSHSTSFDDPIAAAKELLNNVK